MTFFQRYLNKGLVERLEVVNNKWVRVKLLPGASVEGSVSLMKIINEKDNIVDILFRKLYGLT